MFAGSFGLETVFYLTSPMALLKRGDGDVKDLVPEAMPRPGFPGGDHRKAIGI
jgi:hypothetical protein